MTAFRTAYPTPVRDRLASKSFRLKVAFAAFAAGMLFVGITHDSAQAAEPEPVTFEIQAEDDVPFGVCTTIDRNAQDVLVCTLAPPSFTG